MPEKNSQTVSVVFMILFGVSELLAQIPSIESNSIFQLIFNSLKTLSGG